MIATIHLIGWHHGDLYISHEAAIVLWITLWVCIFNAGKN